MGATKGDPVRADQQIPQESFLVLFLLQVADPLLLACIMEMRSELFKSCGHAHIILVREVLG
jgi:hypothetical protein